MKSDNKVHGKKRKKKEESALSQIRSMAVSLLLVALSVGFVIGFRFFLKGRTYHGPVIGAQSTTEDTKDKFQVDKDYDYPYIIVKNLSKKGDLIATKVPGKKDEDSTELENGDLLEVNKKGTYHDKTYYHLKDGLYVEADDSKIQEVKDYVALKGYIAITYISSGGVRVRSWVDYKSEDNIVKSVYVGDKVYVEGMVTTADDITAFRTKEGTYITTDNSYFTDYTNLADLTQTTADSTETTTAADAAQTDTTAVTQADTGSSQTDTAATQTDTGSSQTDTAATQADTGSSQTASTASQVDSSGTSESTSAGESE